MRSASRYIVVAGVIAAILSTSLPVSAHCQIPCGIYDDMMRVRLMREHITTIERSINKIIELEGKGSAIDMNQSVRWVMNKEDHADALTEIVTAYFLQQRIKAPKGTDADARKRYLSQLETLHGLLVGAMKAKQTVNPELPGQLRGLVDELARLYFSEEELKHLNGHHSH